MSIPHVVEIKIGAEVRYLARAGSGRLTTERIDFADYADEERAAANAKALRRALDQSKGPRASVRAISLGVALASATPTQMEAP